MKTGKYPKSHKIWSNQILAEGKAAEKNPLIANKTEEENKKIVAINIRNACEKAIAKMTGPGKEAFPPALEWAINSGYKSATFMHPVQEKDVNYAAMEIWEAYVKQQ